MDTDQSYMMQEKLEHKETIVDEKIHITHKTSSRKKFETIDALRD